MSGSSGALSPTVPAYPRTNDIALSLLALLGAQSGVLTDYNVGSIIRTLGESLGSVIELQGISEQTLAFQTQVYGAMSALGITPRGAQAATGLVTFTAPGPVSQAVLIPGSSLLQTAGGVQFQTTAEVVLASGSTTVNAGVVAVSGGTQGNVAASGISQILTSLAYPLTVLNLSPTAGGATAETLAGTLARFAAAVAAPGLCSPVAIANAAIGLSYGTEVVEYASVLEGWALAGTGAGSGTAGFILYLDDGTGSASANLLASVSAAMSTGTPSLPDGFRPAGVPFSVASVAPTYAIVSCSGSLLPGYGSNTGIVASGVSGALSTYAGSLAIGQTLYQGNLAGVAADAGQGQLLSLSVSLSGNAGGNLTSLSPPYSGRVIPLSISVSF